MSLYEPFGVGNLYVSGRFTQVTDYVVPNDLCADWSALPKKVRGHATVPEFLSRFERRGLALSRIPSSGFRSLIEAVFLRDGKAMACEATTEGTSHYFLGQRLRRLLRSSGQSVVRSYGDWCAVTLDTRAAPYRYDDPPPIQATDLPEFHEDWHGYSGIETDFVVPRKSLVFFPEFEVGAELIGALDAPTTVLRYFEAAKRMKAPLDDDLDWDVLGSDGFLVAYRRPGADPDAQIFLTREAYRILAERDLVVVGAFRPGAGLPPEKLSVVWSAHEVQR